METGRVLQRQGAGRPQISEEIESVRVAYTKSPRTVVPNLSLVTDPFQFILKLTDPYIFMTNPKQIIW